MTKNQSQPARALQNLRRKDQECCTTSGTAWKEDLLVHISMCLGLQDINVDMQAGEITVVMGLSGSGKSTLIRHLNRLIDPTAGEILVDGEDVMALSRNGLAQLRQNKMSMVFQKVRAAAASHGLQNAAAWRRGEGRADAKPRPANGLTASGCKVMRTTIRRNLSGGMQQRVGIARALTANRYHADGRGVLGARSR